MSEHRKGVMMRCPVCFSRENDVVLFREGDGYYCIKCGFTGTGTVVREMYVDLRKKYRWIATRLTVDDQRGL